MAEKKKCCICQAEVDSKIASILTMSGYGNPRYLCADCEALVDTATLGDDYEKIMEAMDRLGKTLADNDKGDTSVFDALTDIFAAAGERAEKIREGSYDFSLDSVNDDEGFDEIPEELQETEEDKIKDKRDEKINRVLDKVTSWICGIAMVATLGYFLLKFVFRVI